MLYARARGGGWLRGGRGCGRGLLRFLRLESGEGAGLLAGFAGRRVRVAASVESVLVQFEVFDFVRRREALLSQLTASRVVRGQGATYLRILGAWHGPAYTRFCIKLATKNVLNVPNPLNVQFVLNALNSGESLKMLSICGLFLTFRRG